MKKLQTWFPVLTAFLLLLGVSAVFKIIPTQSFFPTLKQTIPGLKPSVRPTWNRFGMRSVTMKEREKRPNTIRILVLGGAAVNQPTQNDQETWTALLEKMLAKRFSGDGVQVEIAAYGREGALVRDNYQWASRHLADFRPDITVVLHGMEDVAVGLDGRSLVGHIKKGKKKRSNPVMDGYSVPLPYDSLQGSGVVKLAQCSYTSKACWDMYLVLQGLDSVSPFGRPLEWYSENIPDLIAENKDVLNSIFTGLPLPAALSTFRKDFTQLVHLLKQSSGETVVLSVPTLYKDRMTPAETKALWGNVFSFAGQRFVVSNALARQILEAYNSAEEKVAKQVGIKFISLDKMVPKTLDNFFDDSQFTDRGSAVVATAAFPGLSEAVSQIIAKSKSGLAE